MAQYDTLDVIPDRGGARTTTSRAKRTEFVDGYKQKVIVGLHATLSNNTFSYSGTYDDCVAVETFLRDRIGTAFYFRFMPQEPYKLFETSEDITLTHGGGLRWTVAAAFSQYIGF